MYINKIIEKVFQFFNIYSSKPLPEGGVGRMTRVYLAPFMFHTKYYYFV